MSLKQGSEKGILLESGTNELEIVEFTIGQAYFGINVIKVREIVEQKPLSKFLIRTLLLKDCLNYAKT